MLSGEAGANENNFKVDLCVLGSGFAPANTE